MSTMEQVIKERDGWKDIAEMHCRNEEYYRAKLTACGLACGNDVYVCDDGTVTNEVLRAKVPEVVLANAKEHRADLGHILMVISSDEKKANYPYLIEWIQSRLAIFDLKGRP